MHQFTEDMVSDRNLTRGRPEVALISNMDGFGTPDLKKGVYGRLSISQPATGACGEPRGTRTTASSCSSARTRA